MAKTTGSRAGGDGGNSKIRFIMLEADLNGGDLTQITSAISNALRPPAPLQVPRLIAGATAQVHNGAGANGADTVDAEQLEFETPIDTVREPVAQTPKSSKPRTYAEPEVIEDLDLTGNGDVPFAAYAKSKAPKSDAKRFLTVMAWFKNYAGKSSIGRNEVYTAYRSKGVEWPYGIEDYDGVFRGLVKRKLAKRTETGKYAINQIGEAQIDTADTE